MRGRGPPQPSLLLLYVAFAQLLRHQLVHLATGPLGSVELLEVDLPAAADAAVFASTL